MQELHQGNALFPNVNCALEKTDRNTMVPPTSISYVVSLSLYIASSPLCLIHAKSAPLISVHVQLPNKQTPPVYLDVFMFHVFLKLILIYGGIPPSLTCFNISLLTYVFFMSTWNITMVTCNIYNKLHVT